MSAESTTAQRNRSSAILQRLRKAYPDARCALDHENPLQLLVATILSAQCTDARVNRVTPALFERYPTVEDYADSDRDELEQRVHSTGFYRNKAKAIHGAAAKIVSDYGGIVPQTMDELLTLPGVARKTANAVLGNAFGIASGVVVDTHVFRLSHRMGLVEAKTAEKVEAKLIELVPRAEWIDTSHLMIHHGRAVCPARAPQCDACLVEALCPKLGVAPRKAKPPDPPKTPLAARIAAAKKKTRTK